MADKFDIYKQLLSGGATSDECLFCDNYFNDDDLIIIGGTREQTFNLPFSYDLLRKLAIVYVEDGVTLLTKTLDDTYVSSFDDSLLYYTLTEDETFRFSPGEIKVQMKCLLEDGSILISQIFNVLAVDTIDNKYFNTYDLEMYPILVDVNKQVVELKQLSKLVSGTYDLYKCRFNFDSTWDKFVKIAMFKDEYNHLAASVIKNNICSIPNIISFKAGRINVGVLGEYDGKVWKPTEWSNSVRVTTSSNMLDSPTMIIDFNQADEDTPGIMKLYQSFGYNTDGAISQKVVTDGVNRIKFSIDENDDQCIVLNTIWDEA